MRVRENACVKRLTQALGQHKWHLWCHDLHTVSTDDFHQPARTGHGVCHRDGSRLEYSRCTVLNLVLGTVVIRDLSNILFPNTAPDKSKLRMAGVLISIFVS